MTIRGIIQVMDKYPISSEYPEDSGIPLTDGHYTAEPRIFPIRPEQIDEGHDAITQQTTPATEPDLVGGEAVVLSLFDDSPEIDASIERHPSNFSAQADPVDKKPEERDRSNTSYTPLDEDTKKLHKKEVEAIREKYFPKGSGDKS